MSVKVSARSSTRGQGWQKCRKRGENRGNVIVQRHCVEVVSLVVLRAGTCLLEEEGTEEEHLLTNLVEPRSLEVT